MLLDSIFIRFTALLLKSILAYISVYYCLIDVLHFTSLISVPPTSH